MEHLQRFLDGYVAAWKQNDPGAAGALFAEDALYYPHPWDEPLRGRAEIERMWGEETDPPESFEAEYRAEHAAGDRGVGYGISRYADTEKFPGGAEFHNVFLLRFDDSGLVTEYREWYMRRRLESNPPPQG